MLTACLVCYNLQNNLGKTVQLTHTALILKCGPYSDWVFILEVETTLSMSVPCQLLVNWNTDHYLLPTLLPMMPIWPWSTQCKILHHSSHELLLLLLLVLCTGGFQQYWLEPSIRLPIANINYVFNTKWYDLTRISRVLYQKWFIPDCSLKCEMPSNELSINARRNRDWSQSFHLFSRYFFMPSHTLGSGWLEKWRYIPTSVRSTGSGWVQSDWLMLVAKQIGLMSPMTTSSPFQKVESSIMSQCFSASASRAHLSEYVVAPTWALMMVSCHCKTANFSAPQRLWRQMNVTQWVVQCVGFAMR